jgi:transposase
MAARRLAAHSKKAFDENAHLVLIDETGVLTAPLVRRTLAPRGQTPILRQKGAHREKVSVIAALTLAPKRQRFGLYFKALPKGSFNAVQIAAFLRDLLRQLRGRVIIVWDNATTHRGPVIQKLLRKFPRLWLENFPPYAPDLNPVEQIWTWLKWSKLANYPAENANAIQRRVCPTLSGCRHKHQQLRSFFEASNLPLPQRPLKT